MLLKKGGVQTLSGPCRILQYTPLIIMGATDSYLCFCLSWLVNLDKAYLIISGLLILAKAAMKVLSQITLVC